MFHGEQIGGVRSDSDGARVIARRVQNMRNPTNLVAKPEKIVAALAYLMQLAQERGVAVTQYDLVKSLFLADKAHLNKWGRPISFDNYFAMRHGPVPSVAYDFLKANPLTMNIHGIDSLPWVVTEEGMGKFHFYAKGGFEPNMDLSESDMYALSDALTTVKALTFGQIRRLTHEDPAYIEAWDVDGPESASYPMDLKLFFDERSPETDDVAETLMEYSAYVSTG